MKYLDFNKAYPVCDVNGGWVVADNGETVTVPFAAFFKGIIMGDDRWGKNIKTLTFLMDIRDQVKILSYNDSNSNKILELENDAWQICLEIIENPANGYNVGLADALFSHIKDLKEASDISPKTTNNLA